jgi:hypothetical protein
MFKNCHQRAVAKQNSLMLRALFGFTKLDFYRLRTVCFMKKTQGALSTVNHAPVRGLVTNSIQHRFGRHSMFNRESDHYLSTVSPRVPPGVPLLPYFSAVPNSFRVTGGFIKIILIRPPVV